MIVVQRSRRPFCSDLHLYRGLEACPIDVVMGHEFVGTVVALGASVSKFGVGDAVVSPFTTCWFVQASKDLGEQRANSPSQSAYS